MARVKVVSLGELDSCACETVLNFFPVPDEEHPRCFECVKPIRRMPELNAEFRWKWLVIHLWLALEAEDTDADSTASQ